MIFTLAKVVGAVLFYAPGLAGLATIWTRDSALIAKLLQSALVVIIYLLVMRWLRKQEAPTAKPAQPEARDWPNVVVDDQGRRILVVDPAAIPKEHLQRAKRSKFAPFLEKLEAARQAENKRRREMGLPKYDSLAAFQKDHPPDEIK